VRVDVKLIPIEDDDQKMYVTTASHQYSTWIEYESEFIEISFGISGKVLILDDGNIFVTYNASTTFSEEDSNGEFGSEGSAVLTPGKETEVAHVGEKTLVIKASYVQDKK
jgi:hypothetical protein